MSRPHRGFTLIELLIVVVIIGILASIGVPRFQTVKGKALLAAMRTDLRSLAIAQEAYFAAHATFAGDLATLDVSPSPSVQMTVVSAGIGGWAATAEIPGGFGTTCALFTGDAPPAPPATVEGLVACD